MTEIQTSALPSYRACPQSPELPPHSAGIAIAAPARVSRAFPLYGAFAVPLESAAGFAGHLLNAAVVLIRGPYPAVWNVGAGELLFEDDLVEEGGLVFGYFNVDLLRVFNLVGDPNVYRLTASIFEYVSEVVTVEVE
jgi:hypothetical protein